METTEKRTTADRRREEKTTRIEQRYDDLMGAPASLRMRTLNAEFGPYWYHYLLSDGPFPDEFRNSRRYLNWNAEENRKRNEKARTELDNHRAQMRKIFGNQQTKEK